MTVVDKEHTICRFAGEVHHSRSAQGQNTSSRVINWSILMGLQSVSLFTEACVHACAMICSTFCCIGFCGSAVSEWPAE